MFAEPDQPPCKHIKPLIKYIRFTLKNLLPFSHSTIDIPGISPCEIVNFISTTFLSAPPAINNSDRSNRAAPYPAPPAGD